MNYSDKSSKNNFAVRFAPSPTGYLHIGGLGMALSCYMLARTHGGKNYLRIEDTDQKREVSGAAEELIKTLASFGIVYDGEPVYQSKRAEIYQRYANELVEKKLAYTEQNEDGSVSIRFKAPEKTTIVWNDLVKGQISLPSLERDPIIIKSNGLPPYNLAHFVDDTLMGITHVVRGEEWISSTAEHIQIWRAVFGNASKTAMPLWQYAHMPVICTIEDGNKRKLSKRKDREALVENFIADGYPKEALIEYLLTLYNTNFELWRTANPNTPWQDFPFTFEKIGSNSPLFDWMKLNDISKNIISNWPQSKIEEEVYSFFKDKLTKEQYAKVYELLAVDRGTERPRKDIAKYSDILTEFDYIFKPTPNNPLINRYTELVKKSTSKEHWIELVKQNANDFGFKNMREFTQAVRVQLTGKEFTTDLYTISKLMLT